MKFTQLLFCHTTTLGVRETEHRRSVLTRSTEKLQTPWGEIAVKRAQGWGVDREKPEFEQLRAIADETGLSMGELRRHLNKTDR